VKHKPATECFTGWKQAAVGAAYCTAEDQLIFINGVVVSWHFFSEK
jgi:hypothetical protein